MLIGMGHQIKDITEDAISVFPMSHSNDEKAQPAVVPQADFSSPDPNDPCNSGTTNLTSTQKNKFNTIDNVLNNHAKIGDFTGVAIEISGGKILDAFGVPRDHITEMRNSVRALERSINSLKGSLNNCSLDTNTRRCIESKVNEANHIKELMERTLKQEP